MSDFANDVSKLISWYYKYTTAQSVLDTVHDACGGTRFEVLLTSFAAFVFLSTQTSPRKQFVVRGNANRVLSVSVRSWSRRSWWRWWRKRPVSTPPVRARWGKWWTSSSATSTATIRRSDSPVKGSQENWGLEEALGLMLPLVNSSYCAANQIKNYPQRTNHV